MIEAKKRRGKYCEKELMEKIVFEKPSKKHWVNFSKYLFLKNYRSTAYIYKKKKCLILIFHCYDKLVLPNC